MLTASNSRHAVGRGPGVDSISQAASGLGHDAPAPIRGRAPQPEPIVNRSRGGSGLCRPGFPRESRAARPPPPAGRPAHTACSPGKLRGEPGDRHASVFPPCTPAAGAVETVTGETATAGPVMGLGCGAERTASSSLGSRSRAAEAQLR